MKKLLLILVPLAAVAGWFIYQAKTELPSVPFAKTSRERLSATLSTNGKVEPLTYTEVRALTSGLVQHLRFKQGEEVQAGQALAEMSQPGEADELAAAEARLGQTKAELAALEAGGRSVDIAEIEGTQARLRTQREVAQQNLDALERLVKANAATRYEADQVRNGIRELDTQLDALTKRRGSLVQKTDVEAAKARVREAEAGVTAIRNKIARGTVKLPASGTLYNLPIRDGAFLNAGEILASVGRLDPVRVRVYVDEPELGRVQPGQPVRITWDALPGKEWTGKVEQKPTQVVALGSRQVGEVLCTIENPGRDLVPGTNVNAFVLTQVVENALTIPRTAVRRESGVGVYVLDKTTNTVTWKNVKTGSSDALRVEVVSGLNDGDIVAEPSDVALANGLKVAPTIH